MVKMVKMVLLSVIFYVLAFPAISNAGTICNYNPQADYTLASYIETLDFDEDTLRSKLHELRSDNASTEERQAISEEIRGVMIEKFKCLFQNTEEARTEDSDIQQG